MKKHDFDANGGGAEGLERLLGHFTAHTHPEIYDCQSCPQEQQRCPQDMIDNGQSGKVLTAFNGCSDSRAHPALIFKPRMGDMFPVVNAGAFLTPYEQGNGTTQAWASLEYAVTHLGVKDIVQFGHTECGAIAGLVSMAEHGAIKLPHLAGLLGGVSHMVQEAQTLFGRQHGREPQAHELRRAIEEHNVRLGVRHLREYIHKHHPQSGVRVHGWLYDMRGANILAVQANGSFQPITHLPARADYGRLPGSCAQGVAERAHRLVFQPRPIG